MTEITESTVLEEIEANTPQLIQREECPSFWWLPADKETEDKNTEEIKRLTEIQHWRRRQYPIYNDQGFVRLVDVVGHDFTPIEAARLTAQSTGKGLDDDIKLLRYLRRHKHDTPFEFPGLHLHLQLPMDAWRQAVRHRTFSINEWSTRYSPPVSTALWTNPGEWRKQAKSNRQGSDGSLEEWDEHMRLIAGAGPEGCETPGQYLTLRETELHSHARTVYEERVKMGVALEQARKDLPLSTMTQVYVEADIRCWFHFLSLRLDPHAQKEIRELSTAIAYILKHFFPVSYAAFKDYTLNAMTLTALDIEVLREINASGPSDPTGATPMALVESIMTDVGMTDKRERKECLDKLIKLEVSISV